MVSKPSAYKEWVGHFSALSNISYDRCIYLWWSGLEFFCYSRLVYYPLSAVLCSLIPSNLRMSLSLKVPRRSQTQRLNSRHDHSPYGSLPNPPSFLEQRFTAPQHGGAHTGYATTTHAQGACPGRASGYGTPTTNRGAAPIQGGASTGDSTTPVGQVPIPSGMGPGRHLSMYNLPSNLQTYSSNSISDMLQEEVWNWRMNSHFTHENVVIF